MTPIANKSVIIDSCGQHSHGALVIGSVLDKYEVVQKIGEGGMATVYRGRHTTLARDVAIKILHPHLSCSARNRRRFAREAKAIEHLRHDNILEIYDYSGEAAEDCYIVTELINGRTLTELISDVGRTPSEVATLIGIALAEALEFAHTQGILHRDVKPDNVMIRNDGVVKLMDFGIARFLDESQVTMTGALIGSPAYMSPEQAREADLDQRSDLFSLGTVLFQLVTGHLPFQGGNPSIVLKNIIEGNRPSISELVSNVSAGFSDIIDRLLQPDREQRFTRAGEVADALRMVLAEVDISPIEPLWSLENYLRDPADYTTRLDAHLLVILLQRGKQELARGDALAALRLFNRLLSIDENNAEVLGLVQGQPAKDSRSRRWQVVVIIAAAGVAVCAAIWLSRTSVTPVFPVENQPPPVVTETTALNEIVPVQPPADVAAPIKAKVPEPRIMIPHPRQQVIESVESATSATALSKDKPAQVTFQVVGEGWAEVYCDGRRRVGKTRPPDNRAELPVGSHRCRFVSPYIQEEVVEFDVAPGEQRTIAVVLRPKPLIVPIEESCMDSCLVYRDGVSLGIVGALGRTIVIDRPDRPHTIELKCGEKTFEASIYGTVRSVSCGVP